MFLRQISIKKEGKRSSMIKKHQYEKDSVFQWIITVIFFTIIFIVLGKYIISTLLTCFSIQLDSLQFYTVTSIYPGHWWSTFKVFDRRNGCTPPCPKDS